MSKNLQKDGKHVLEFTHCYWSSFTAVSLDWSDDSVPKDVRLFFLSLNCSWKLPGNSL